MIDRATVGMPAQHDIQLSVTRNKRSTPAASSQAAGLGTHSDACKAGEIVKGE